ncbi:MAG: ABC transporter substrate-binding protein [Aquabacterium sp.]
MPISERFHPIGPRRHWLCAAAAWPALAWVGDLRAQARPPVVVGWLSPIGGEKQGGALAAFNEGMAALGWTLGTQYVVQARHAEGRVERLPALAQELAALKPAVIVAWSSEAVRVAARAAPTTPIVRARGDSPLTGLVHSLARPGGMVTGISSSTDELYEKTIEMLLESMPRLQRIGFMSDTASQGRAENVARARRAGERLRFEALFADLARPEDIEPAMARLAADKAQALVILPSTWLDAKLERIIELAQAQRWPVVGLGAGLARRGGLLGYGPNAAAEARRPAYFVDRILKGAKPGDLPIEQPTTFDLVINLKTAKALGVTIPRSMLARATEVIE